MMNTLSFSFVSYIFLPSQIFHSFILRNCVILSYLLNSFIFFTISIPFLLYFFQTFLEMLWKTQTYSIFIACTLYITNFNIFSPFFVLLFFTGMPSIHKNQMILHWILLCVYNMYYVYGYTCADCWRNFQRYIW